jgi:alkylhydroperoxidase family enzyme
MVSYPTHTLETAPEDSKGALIGLKAAFGFLPNIAGAMATSSVLIKSLAAVFQNVHAGSFSEPQIQTLLLTNAVTNASDWPIAFHAHLALEHGVSAGDVDAIRAGLLPADVKDAALSRLARALIEKRGRISDEDAEAFLSVGFEEKQLLEVIAIVAASTITNYTANVTRPTIEPPFNRHANG